MNSFDSKNLRDLKKMVDNGILTEEEYSSQKELVLNPRKNKVIELECPSCDKDLRITNGTPGEYWCKHCKKKFTFPLDKINLYPPNIKASLKELKALEIDGIITAKEFTSQKKELLNNKSSLQFNEDQSPTSNINSNSSQNSTALEIIIRIVVAVVAYSIFYFLFSL